MTEVFDLLLSVKLVNAYNGDSDAYAIHDWCDWQLSPQQRGGLHSAAAATRSGGRFSARDQLSPSTYGVGVAGDQPVIAGDQPVITRSPAGRTSPRLSSPRLSEPVEPVVNDTRVWDTVRASFHPVPKPGRKP
jgi:hypothetical protein